MGRVSITDFISRKVCSTIQSSLYLSATSRALSFVLVVSTQMPSYLASALTFSSSRATLLFVMVRKPRYPLLLINDDGAFTIFSFSDSTMVFRSASSRLACRSFLQIGRAHV